jgi:hypothetical protein
VTFVRQFRAGRVSEDFIFRSVENEEISRHGRLAPYR